MNYLRRITISFVGTVLFALTVGVNAQTDFASQQKVYLAKWATYTSIANQAKNHAAFDAVMTTAKASATVEELAENDGLVWTAFKQLVTTGTTASGQFDLTALIDNNTDVKEFSNTRTANVVHTLKDLPAGMYTMKVQAFNRPIDYLTANTQYESGRVFQKTNMYFGTEMQAVKHINDDARYVPLRTGSWQQGANQRVIPSDLNGAKAAFDAGLYWNVMRVTLDADGDVKMGVRIVSASDNNWMVCGQFRLYYGEPKVSLNLRQSQKFALDEDTYADVATDISVAADDWTPLCLPFDMNAEQTSATFKQVCVIGGVSMDDNKLVGQLVPVTEMQAGYPYYVKVDKATTIKVDDVLVRALRPDSIPALWEGAYMVGKYMTRGYGATLYLASELKSKASTLTWNVADYQNMSFSTNLENAAARKYLSEVTYTEASPSVIYNYYITPPIRRDQPKPVVVPVPKADQTLTLTLANSSDYANASTATYPVGTTQCEIQNLIPTRDYYYKVETADGSVLTKGQFHTDGTVRMIQASSISNVRDLGGWTNCDGNHIRYEKIFRGSEMNVGQVINANDKKKIQALNIKAEIDLRNSGNTGGNTTTSALGNVQFHFADLSRWSDNTLQLDATKWSNIFKFLVKNVNAGNPLYFHCQVGADRTGCLAQMIEGLLGLSRDQIYHDYELTSYSQAGERRKVKVDPAINYIIQNSKGSTMQMHYFNYLNQKLGVSATDLRDFMNNMLDGESSILNLPLQFDIKDGSYFETLTNIYALCKVGSTLASGAKATLTPKGETASSITMKMEGLMITFAQTTLKPGTQYTLTIPAGAVIDPDGNANAEAVSLSFRTPDTFASHGYLYAPSLSKFVGRGANFGSRIITDNIGLPVNIATDTDGDCIISFLDNGLYVSHDGYGDRASTAGNLKWTLESKGDGFALRASSGKYMSVSNGYFTANAASASTATVFVMKTAAEQRQLVQQAQLANTLEAAGRVDISATTMEELQAALSGIATKSYTAKIKNPTSGSTSSWTLTEPVDAKTASAQAYNAGDYGGELFNKHGYVSQSVSVDKPGLYRLTATILSRQGSNANCYKWGKEGYALSNAYLSVNDKYWAMIPDWYSAAASSTNPDNTGQAKSLMGTGKYKVELYAYVDASKKLNIRIYQPAYTTFVWCVFNNFTLTRIETESDGGDDPVSKTYPEDGDKGYLYNLQAKKFINADAVMADEGVRFTIVGEEAYEGGWSKNGNDFTDAAGRTFPSVRFTTAFTDPERENKPTMLSCRADNQLTATKVNGYGVFPLYYVEGKGLLIYCFYNKDSHDFYTPGKCLSYDANGNLVFVDEKDATYWKFVSQAEYNKLTGQGEETENDYTGPGYSKLEPSMFRHWDDAVNPTTSEAVACDYHIDEPAITVYGDANLTYLNFADLSDYDKLIVVVTSDHPRMYFNKVDGGKYDANNEAASGRIEVTPAGGWAQRYFTIEDDVWTIDLAAIVRDKGYARLNGIKGPTYDTTVTVSHMVLFKDTSVGVSAVTERTVSDDTIYNLAGQKQATLQKGLNIVGGKKILMK